MARKRRSIYNKDGFEMSEEDQIIEANMKLLTKGDDSEVECPVHGVKTTFGQLSWVAQLALLSGLDVSEEHECILLS